MSRLIDGDALKKSLIESADRCREWITDCMDAKDNEMQGRAEQALLTFNECIMRINAMPTIEERKTGKWNRRKGMYEVGFKCSECNTFSIAETPYCSFCGARMMQEGEDNGCE